MTTHDHVLSWDGPKCLWCCAVSECDYSVYEERLNVSFLAAVSPERMQAVADQIGITSGHGR